MVGHEQRHQFCDQLIISDLLIANLQTNQSPNLCSNVIRCSCDNCWTKFLINCKECYCCRAIEGCMDSLKSLAVLEDRRDPMGCITQHLGFASVCLDK